MSPKLLLVISILFFSCHNGQGNKQPVDSLATNNSVVKETARENKTADKPIITVTDSTSSDYLIYSLKNEKGINNYWTQRLTALDEFVFPLDTMSHLSIIRNWTINDSISVIILSHTTGTSNNEFLLTIKNKKEFVSKVHIGDNADSDLSLANPYFYTVYKLVSDRNVQLFNHKIVGVEGGAEKDRILSTALWLIQDDGRAVKK